MARKKRYTPGNMKVEEAYYGGEVHDLGGQRSIARSNKGGGQPTGKAKPRDASGRFIKVNITGA